jgi:pSer/pThr/pTyr-binding forkhead associated (FHA) protein
MMTNMIIDSLRKFFGEDVFAEDDALTEIMPPPDGGSGSAARKINVSELVLEKLQTSFADWLLVNRVPGTYFVLSRVETMLTPENKEFLQPFLDLKPNTRNNRARKYLVNDDSRDLVTFGMFLGWNIVEQFSDGNGDDDWETELFVGTKQGCVLRFRPFGRWDEPEAVAGGETARPPLLTLTIESRAGTQRREVFSLNEFPLTLGRGTHNDVQIGIENEAVSRNCLRIVWDENARRSIVENAGHNEISVDGRAIAKDGRQFLCQKGVIAIAAGGDPVTIRYQGAHSRQDETPTLLPTAGAAHAGTAAGHSVSRNGTEADRLQPTIDAVRPEIADPDGRTEPKIDAARSFAHSEIADPDGRMEPKIETARPLARLEIEYPGGRAQAVDVQSLPLEIGREPVAAGGQAVLIDDPSCTVSRRHLRIERSGEAGFIVENRGHKNGGTSCDDRKMPPQFALDPAAAQWLTLANTVRIRLCKVD